MEDGIKNKSSYSPVSGDILFQDLDCGALCSAIEEVTLGFDSAEFSHIGLVQEVDGKWMVLEAISEGVKYTPLDDFLKRSLDSEGRPKIWVGRVKRKYQPLLAKLNVTDYMGLPYDDVFIMNNGKYYCSELLYEIFKKANNNKPFFELEPMTFKSPKSNAFLEVWLDYYRKLNRKIPEGKAGINPAGISRSSKIEIVQKLGTVSKK